MVSDGQWDRIDPSYSSETGSKESSAMNILQWGERYMTPAPHLPFSRSSIRTGWETNRGDAKSSRVRGKNKRYYEGTRQGPADNPP